MRTVVDLCAMLLRYICDEMGNSAQSLPILIRGHAQFDGPKNYANNQPQAYDAPRKDEARAGGNPELTDEIWLKLFVFKLPQADETKSASRRVYCPNDLKAQQAWQHRNICRHMVLVCVVKRGARYSAMQVQHTVRFSFFQTDTPLPPPA